MNKTRVAVVSAGILLVIPATAGVAATKAGSVGQERVGAASGQAFQQRTQDVSTTSKTWQTFPMRGSGQGQGVSSPPLSVYAKGPIAVTLSVDVVGAPVQVRVRDGRQVLRPSLARFQGEAGDTSRSFTFVTKGSKNYRCHDLAAQWRSLSGGLVESPRSSMHVTFNGKKGKLSKSACKSQA